MEPADLEEACARADLEVPDKGTRAHLDGPLRGELRRRLPRLAVYLSGSLRGGDELAGGQGLHQRRHRFAERGFLTGIPRQGLLGAQSLPGAEGAERGEPGQPERGGEHQVHLLLPAAQDSRRNGFSRARRGDLSRVVKSSGGGVVGKALSTSS